MDPTLIVPLLVTIGVASSIAIGMIVMDTVVGPSSQDSEKGEAYECGVYRGEDDDSRTNVRAPFFSTALEFLIFGVEIAFLLPWAIEFRELGWGGFVLGSIFLAFLTIGLIYSWRKGALEWE